MADKISTEQSTIFAIVHVDSTANISTHGVRYLFSTPKVSVVNDLQLAQNPNCIGVVSIGPGTIVSPRTVFRCSKKGKIIIGGFNMIEDDVSFSTSEDTEEDGNVIEVGDRNTFECGTVVLGGAISIGNHNLFKCRAEIKSSVGSNCIVGAKVIIDHPLSDNEAILCGQTGFQSKKQTAFLAAINQQEQKDVLELNMKHLTLGRSERRRSSASSSTAVPAAT